MVTHTVEVMVIPTENHMVTLMVEDMVILMVVEVMVTPMIMKVLPSMPAITGIPMA